MNCTCSETFKRTHYSHEDGCPYERAMDRAYLKGWDDALLYARSGLDGVPDPTKLMRVWASHEEVTRSA